MRNADHLVWRWNIGTIPVLLLSVLIAHHIFNNGNYLGLAIVAFTCGFIPGCIWVATIDAMIFQLLAEETPTIHPLRLFDPRERTSLIGWCVTICKVTVFGLLHAYMIVWAVTQWVSLDHIRLLVAIATGLVSGFVAHQFWQHVTSDEAAP